MAHCTIHGQSSCYLVLLEPAQAAAEGSAWGISIALRQQPKQAQALNTS